MPLFEIRVTITLERVMTRNQPAATPLNLQTLKKFAQGIFEQVNSLAVLSFPVMPAPFAEVLERFRKAGRDLSHMPVNIASDLFFSQLEAGFDPPCQLIYHGVEAFLAFSLDYL